jgi:outer membrane protein assembly factor BamB
VYVGSQDGKLYAFPASCTSPCSPLWSAATGSYIFSSPAVANGVVYVGSDDGKLHAFPASCSDPCSPLWTSAATGGGIESPAVANGVVYVGSGYPDGKLYAFDLGAAPSPSRPDPSRLRPDYRLSRG